MFHFHRLAQVILIVFLSKRKYWASAKENFSRFLQRKLSSNIISCSCVASPWILLVNAAYGEKGRFKSRTNSFFKNNSCGTFRICKTGSFICLNQKDVCLQFLFKLFTRKYLWCSVICASALQQCQKMYIIIFFQLLKFIHYLIKISCFIRTYAAFIAVLIEINFRYLQHNNFLMLVLLF